MLLPPHDSISYIQLGIRLTADSTWNERTNTQTSPGRVDPGNCEGRTVRGPSPLARTRQSRSLFRRWQAGFRGVEFALASPMGSLKAQWLDCLPARRAFFQHLGRCTCRRVD